LFETGPATLAYCGIAAAACLVASTWGVATLSVAGLASESQFLESWQTWWLGDLIGILVFAPVFLTWRQSFLVGSKAWRFGEMSVAFVLLAVSAAVVFAAGARRRRGSSLTSCAACWSDRLPVPAERRRARHLPAVADRDRRRRRRRRAVRRRKERRVAAVVAGIHRGDDQSRR
jgi:hypothetical protein